ncbi:hypothetical protein JCM10908_005489 [Rhodotorula pacifica]|uniref:uncharacterized protein n=1 Tax=Rhodotorula pacifica TaxID=1495444 RepID=UPI00316C942D
MSRSRRVASGLSALANCLTAGDESIESIEHRGGRGGDGEGPTLLPPFVFPLWAPEVARVTRTSPSHLQLVATAAILGEYVSAALFGAIADRRGPGAVSTIAGLTFGVGLGSLAWRYSVCDALLAKGEAPWPHEWVLLATAWFIVIVGCGTAASYFSAMCSLSKSAPASHAGLAIALPCAVFGLSPLFLSGVASLFTTAAKAVDEGAALDVQAYLGFLGALLMAVNLAGGFLIRDLPWQQNIDRIIVAAIEPFPDEENLSGYASPGEQASERSPLLARWTADEVGGPDAVKPESTKGDSFRAFVSTTSFWVLGAVVFFSTGPAEMYMASVAQIIESLAPTSESTPSKRHFRQGTLTLSEHHVALLSISNTIGRLVIGAASDYLSRPATPGKKRSGWRRQIRLVFVGGACILLALACLWACTGMSSPAGLWIVTPAIAIAYGTIFTLVPALVRARWNILDFGRNWGTLTWFSAAGAMLYTPLYGILLDFAQRSTGRGGGSRDDGDENAICVGPRCYKPIFAISAASAAVAGLLVVVLARRWSRRAIVA